MRRSRARVAVAAVSACAVLALTFPPGAAAAITSAQAYAIALEQPAVKAAIATSHGALQGTVSYAPGVIDEHVYAPRGEIALVVISAATGQVRALYTGVQVIWPMARGYAGAFGHHIEALYVWLALCLLFLVPFVDWRRRRSMLNLDLAMLVAFSVSLGFFDRGDIDASVPLSYPPLLYLLARLLWLGLSRRERPRAVLRLNVPVSWLALGIVFLVAFRVGLEAVDANVIDVGYATAVGAQKVLHGESLYGGFPAQIVHGDTYGPVIYEGYAPFVGVFGFSGHWDDLPAVRVGSIFFDLLCIALLFVLGRRIRGPSMGVVLAYAWVAFPFTALVLESNSNDALVAALVLASLVAASSAPARGAMAMLAGLAKVAPLALLPLLGTHRLRERGGRELIGFALGAGLAGALALEPALIGDTLSTVYRRTVAYQAGRAAPFSLWGLYGGLTGVQQAVQVLGALLAVAVALLPRRGDLIGLAACAAAVLIAVELGVTYWFYLYIPWFYGAAIVALLGRHEDLFDGVGAHRRGRPDDHSHQPRILVGG